jgi:integrase
MTSASLADRLGHLQHPPFVLWPEQDRSAFEAVFARDGIFDDEEGPGAHLSAATRRHIESGYGRWLAFLRDHEPHVLDQPPLSRIERTRVTRFVRSFPETVRLTTVVSIIEGLRYAARLMDDGEGWEWLRRLHRRLTAEAVPLNRFPNLTPTPDTYHLGIKMMERASTAPAAAHLLNEVAYRDGLVIALLSLWPIRRRSLAALTVSRHIDLSRDGIVLRLHPEDTKARRAEAFTVPADLLPFLRRYLSLIRPALMRMGKPNARDHDALWVSQRGSPLTADRLYASVRRQVVQEFGRPMGLHDFRRSAATTMAVERPNLAPLIPGILQHNGPDVADRHYKLARSAEAGRRFVKRMNNFHAAATERDEFWET